MPSHSPTGTRSRTTCRSRLPTAIPWPARSFERARAWTKRTRMTSTTARHRERRKATIWGYVFILPLLVLFVGFTIWPILASWGYSFFDWNGVGAPQDWVGLDNFVEALTAPAFWNAFT